MSGAKSPGARGSMPIAQVVLLVVLAAICAFLRYVPVPYVSLLVYVPGGVLAVVIVCAALAGAWAECVAGDRFGYVSTAVALTTLATFSWQFPRALVCWCLPSSARLCGARTSILDTLMSSAWAWLPVQCAAVAVISWKSRGPTRICVLLATCAVPISIVVALALAQDSDVAAGLALVPTLVAASTRLFVVVLGARYWNHELQAHYVLCFTAALVVLYASLADGGTAGTAWSLLSLARCGGAWLAFLLTSTWAVRRAWAVQGPSRGSLR